MLDDVYNGDNYGFPQSFTSFATKFCGFLRTLDSKIT